MVYDIALLILALLNLCEFDEAVGSKSKPQTHQGLFLGNIWDSPNSGPLVASHPQPWSGDTASFHLFLI
jgi:hypothetical protein